MLIRGRIQSERKLIKRDFGESPPKWVLDAIKNIKPKQVCFNELFGATKN